MLILTKTMANTINDILLKYQHGEPLDIKTNNDINTIKDYLNKNIKDLSDTIKFED